MNLSQFEARTKNPERALVVELWAPWCGPCRMMEPALKQAAQKYTGRVELLRLNADQSPEIVSRLHVFGIPTMIGYSKGREVFRKTGAQSAASIEALFEHALTGERAPLTITSPGKMDRILRLVSGLALMAIGWFGGHAWFLLLAGAGILFSAVYDRCPIYRAIMPRVRELIQK
jgi:thioredoxin 1